MSENVFDAEYGRTVSPSENGNSEKRDDITRDLEEFCVETLVFENKDSILDAVMNVSKGDTLSETTKVIKSAENKATNDNTESPLSNGHFKSTSVEKLKENEIVSEYIISNGDEIHEKNSNHDLLQQNGETDREGELPDLINENKESTVNKINGFSLNDDFFIINNGDEVEEHKTEISTANGINLNEKYITSVKENNVDGEEYLDKQNEINERADDRCLQHEDDISQEKNESEKDTSDQENKILDEDFKTEAEVNDNGDGCNEVSNGEKVEEEISKDESDNNVLSFIKKKTKSLGRNLRNEKIISKSDETPFLDHCEKSKKRPLFKIFNKEKHNEDEKDVENDSEIHTDDKVTKSFTKVHTEENKSDKKGFKFFKNVFHISDKKSKHESGDKNDESGVDGEIAVNGNLKHDAQISTDNVIHVFQTSFNTPSPNKLFTINELECEKKDLVINNELGTSQEDYLCADELNKDSEEVFKQMVDLSSHNMNGVIVNPESDVPLETTLSSSEQKILDEAEVIENPDFENFKDDTVKAEASQEKVQLPSDDNKISEEYIDNDIQKEQTEATDEIVDVKQEESVEIRDSIQEDMINDIEKTDKNELKKDEILTKDVESENVKEINNKIEDDEPKKIKKKNFTLTLPSFKFPAFSKEKSLEGGIKKDKRQSMDNLDNAKKLKAVNKRTKSFHFGKKSKKSGEDEEIKDKLVVVKSIENDAIKIEPKSKYSTLKWPKFSKKTDKKDETLDIKKSKESKSVEKQSESRGNKPSRQSNLTRSFLKFFTKKSSDSKGNELNGMVYSLEDNMVIAADNSLSFGGCYESGQALQEGDGGKPFVVVAIDFGTTFSGYAFSFMTDHHSDHHPIHIMRKWEGGDPGVNNQKAPTIILLTPNQDFHTFGFTARDFYHNLDATESAKWLYFDKFKMALHNMDIHENLTIPAANGVHVSALKLFSFALKYFKDHAIKELTSQSETEIKPEDIRWVITVPAIWKAPAKQFMRKAAHMAEITTVEGSNKLLIALEPEAASIYIRRLKRNQLVPETPAPEFHHEIKQLKSNDSNTSNTLIDDQFKSGTRYIVVDCGGGTVDLTVHEMEREGGHLKELYKATGGPYGSTGVDHEFEKLLRDIFGSDFIDTFKVKRPAGWVDLMIAFESRKRTCSPFKQLQHNVSMPFSFIDFYKKFSHNTPIDEVVKRYNDDNIRWSPQGMLRLSAEAMTGLFDSTVSSIISLISNVIFKSQVQGIEYLFLVGGFAESPLLQQRVRRHFEERIKVIIPQDVSLTILRGAVCYGLDPTVVSLRRSHLTYGIGVVHKFIAGEHDPKKLVKRDGVEWCTDVFDSFVKNNQPVALNDSVIRRYAAIGQQDCVTICVYSSEEKDVKYVTDAGVRKCATLTLKLDSDDRHFVTEEADQNTTIESHFQEVADEKPDNAECSSPTEAEGETASGESNRKSGRTIKQIDAVMTFGDTEIKVTALEVESGKSVKASIDFLNL